MKKSGILLAVLALAAFSLVLSPAASAQTAPAPAAVVQAPQLAAPLPSFLTAPQTQTPAAAKSPASGIEWLDASTAAICRCRRSTDCRTTGACCYFTGRNCGICC